MFQFLLVTLIVFIKKPFSCSFIYFCSCVSRDKHRTLLKELFFFLLVFFIVFKAVIKFCLLYFVLGKSSNQVVLVKKTIG